MRKKLEFRSLSEADLSARERQGAYGRQSAAVIARLGRERVISMARRDRDGWDEKGRWVVATCRVGRENAVSDSLDEAQIECWCPRERLKARPRRGLPAVDIFRPIFRGYIFARVIPDSYAFTGLLAAAPLRGLMCQDGRPYLMADDLIVRLRLAALEREGKQKDVDALPPLPDLVGKTVLIRSGPFADFAVTVRKLLSKQRKVLVDVPMFGAMKEVAIGVDTLNL